MKEIELLTRQVENLSRQISNIRREFQFKFETQERHIQLIKSKILNEKPVKNTDNIFDAIFSSIYEVTGVTEFELSSKSRKAEICDSRKYYYYATMLYNIKRKDAGIRVARDHSSVVDGIQQCINFIETEKHFAYNWERIQEKIQEKIKHHDTIQ